MTNKKTDQQVKGQKVGQTKKQRANFAVYHKKFLREENNFFHGFTWQINHVLLYFNAFLRIQHVVHSAISYFFFRKAKKKLYVLLRQIKYTLYLDDMLLSMVHFQFGLGKQ